MAELFCNQPERRVHSLDAKSPLWTGDKIGNRCYLLQRQPYYIYYYEHNAVYYQPFIFPNKNKDKLAPGQTKSCSSPIGTKIKAHAPNGKNWLRTISTRGGEYYIVERPGNKGIKIVP